MKVRWKSFAEVSDWIAENLGYNPSIHTLDTGGVQLTMSVSFFRFRDPVDAMMFRLKFA
jgi:hypothetical protein